MVEKTITKSSEIGHGEVKHFLEINLPNYTFMLNQLNSGVRGVSVRWHSEVLKFLLARYRYRYRYGYRYCRMAWHGPMPAAHPANKANWSWSLFARRSRHSTPLVLAPVRDPVFLPAPPGFLSTHLSTRRDTCHITQWKSVDVVAWHLPPNESLLLDFGRPSKTVAGYLFTQAFALSCPGFLVWFCGPDEWHLARVASAVDPATK